MLKETISAILTGLLQLSFLHNQPSCTFELLQATLQHSEWTCSSFSLTLWPWVNIKVIRNGIKLQSLEMLSIIPSLKQISSQISEHTTMLNVYFPLYTKQNTTTTTKNILKRSRWLKVGSEGRLQALKNWFINMKLQANVIIYLFSPQIWCK